jgi:hypothetical protein
MSRHRKPGPRPRPRSQVRRHRIVLMVNDAELRAIRRLPTAEEQPLSTVAHQLIASRLRELDPSPTGGSEHNAAPQPHP